MITVTKLTTKEILEHYNTLAAKVGVKTVKRFADRKSAERRFSKLLNEHGEVYPVDKKSDEPKKTTKRVGFNFPPKYDVPKKVREGSLRYKAIELLKQGAHFGEILNLCQEWHEKQGIAPRNVERRAYELIRLINHYVGYGLREEGDLIYVYTKQDEMDV